MGNRHPLTLHKEIVLPTTVRPQVCVPSYVHCSRCESTLERPGDYCLVCQTNNADAVVVDLAQAKAVITMLDGTDVRGQTTVPTTPEEGSEKRRQQRNYLGRIVDELHRKRPEEVYLAGDQPLTRALGRRLQYPTYRVDGDAVAAAVDQRESAALEVVEASPQEKLGGSHSTLIGGRAGRRAIGVVAGHPHVKKIIPGPIDAGGTGSRSGLRAKVTRADDGGNVRLLLRDGSSVQENRIVTTAGDRETGERIRSALNEALAEADLR